MKKKQSDLKSGQQSISNIKQNKESKQKLNLKNISTMWWVILSTEKYEKMSKNVKTMIW